MTQQVIGLGTGLNTGSGDPLNVAFTKANANFSDLYAGAGNAPGSVTQYFYPAAPVNFAAIRAAAALANANGGGIVKLPPGTITSDGSSLPLLPGVIYEGSGWAYNQGTNIASGTILNFGGTSHGFTYNAVNLGPLGTNTGPLTKAAYLGGFLNGGGARLLTVTNAIDGFHAGDYYNPGVQGGVFEHLTALNCSGFGFNFANFQGCWFSHLFAFGNAGMGRFSSSPGSFSDTHTTWEPGVSTYEMLCGQVNFVKNRSWLFVTEGAGSGPLNGINVHNLQSLRYATDLWAPQIASSSGTSLTVTDSTKYAVGMPVYLSGVTSTLKNLVTYFVTSIVDSTHITLGTYSVDPAQTSQWVNLTLGTNTSAGATTNGTVNVSFVNNTAFPVGSQVILSGFSGAQNGTYYVILNDPSSGHIQLATNPTGSAVTFAAGSGTANMTVVSQGFPHLEITGLGDAINHGGTQVQPFRIHGMDLEGPAAVMVLAQNVTTSAGPKGGSSELDFNGGYINGNTLYLGFLASACIRACDGITLLGPASPIDQDSTSNVYTFGPRYTQYRAQQAMGLGRILDAGGTLVSGSTARWQNNPPTAALCLSGQGPDLVWNSNQFLDFVMGPIGFPVCQIGNGGTISPVQNGYGRWTSNVQIVDNFGANGSITLPELNEVASGAQGNGDGILLCIFNQNTGFTCTINSQASQAIQGAGTNGTSFVLGALSSCILLGAFRNSTNNLFWTRLM